MKSIKNSVALFASLILGLSPVLAQEKTVEVASFDKVVISPHIEATLVEDGREKVIVEDSYVPLEKLNIKVEGNTLRIYLEGAKSYTKSEKVKYDGYKGRRELYQGTQVVVTINYKHLKELSIRGEENILLESGLDQSDFEMYVYGESEVTINEVDLENLNVTMYGESRLKINDGQIDFQKYKAYGESEVHVLGVANREAKITAYGESEFMVNVSDRLKVTSYGESDIHYKGNPSIDKGILLGEYSLTKL